MDPHNGINKPTVTAVTRVLSAVLSDINMGLFVYHLDDPGDPRSLRLVYANKVASSYTGSDVQQHIGKSIIEAFPGLAATEVPEIFARVAVSREPRELGAIEYEDPSMARSTYAVKAFPMPDDCVGVVFENIAIRKRVDAMVKHMTDDLRERHAALEQRVTALVNDAGALSQQLQARSTALQQRIGATLASDDRKALSQLVDVSTRLSALLDDLADFPSPPDLGDTDDT